MFIFRYWLRGHIVSVRERIGDVGRSIHFSYLVIGARLKFPAVGVESPKAVKRTLRLILPIMLVAGTLFIGPVAEAYPGTSVELEGHGWGHGRGMGQYGALGYALMHAWGHEQILNHFYQGTTPGSLPDGYVMTVRMTRMDGLATIVNNAAGQLLIDGFPGTFNAVKATRINGNTFGLEKAPDCLGPWEPMAEAVTGPITFRPTVYSDDLNETLQLCEPEARRWLRGNLRAVDDSGTQRTVNEVEIGDYLRGVVPRETPASWGDLGGGAGMNALRAQVIAAASYGASENRFWYAKTCDTTACQVYGGRATDSGGVLRDLEDPRTNQAVQETLGQVRMLSGAVARTEFSSSTGGYSAGGTFPAVPDAGDSISLNPNHLWRASVPVTSVEAAWPSIGNLLAFHVTGRNGLGDWGGRVLEVRIEGTTGTVTASGSQVRTRLGLRSDWFRTVGWESLGGVITSGAGVSSWGAGRLDLFARGSDDSLVHKWFDGTWSGFESLGGVLTSDPTAVSWGPGRIDVFARGTDGALWHNWFDGSWKGWESLGGVLDSGPGATSRGPGRLDVFVKGTDGALWQLSWDGAQWTPWIHLGGELDSDPAAAAWSGSRLDIFVRGTDQAMWHRWWDGAQWSHWESLGGVLSSAPDAASWGAGRLDVFVSGSDHGLWHLWFDGSWKTWESLGAPASTEGTGIAGDPGSVSWGRGRIDVFAPGNDRQVWHKWFEGTWLP
jgi:SpoIID/LytB domain protein